MSTNRVLDITNDDHFNATLLSATSQVVIVDFTASWCRPCQLISPVFTQLSNNYPTIMFLRVDIDKCKETARRAAVTSVPSFQVYKRGVKVDGFTGADPARLNTLLRTHQPSVETVTTSGDSQNTTSKSDIPVGQLDLLDCIEKPQVECLNQNKEHPVVNVFSTNNEYLESDCDPQLLIHIPFTQAVRIHSLGFHQLDLKRAPRTIKLFVNKSTMDFSSAETTPSTQDIQLTEQQVSGKQLIPLKYVKFQNVNSITIFVVDNFSSDSDDESDTTAIKHIRIIGTPVQTTKMSEFKRVAGTAGESDG